MIILPDYIKDGDKMAYIEGFPGKKSEKVVSKYTALMVIASLSIIGFLLASSDDWKSDLYSIIFLGVFILLLIFLVTFKLNPLVWKKYFNRKEYERLIDNESRVINKLGELDDSYFILNDFTFELFHMEHLVVSENGIFVLVKSPYPGELRIDEEILYAGDKSIDDVISRLWRLCHLINILVKKGFDNFDVMPKPVLVIPEQKRASLAEFSEVTIAGIDELNDLITGKLKFRIDKEKAEGFALFMKQRYLK